MKIDPESASELLVERIAAEQEAAELAEIQKAEQEASEARAKQLEKEAEKLRKEAEREAKKQRERSEKRRSSVLDNFLRSGARTLGREISRNIFGTRRR